jgi:hypothetical protein
MIVDRRGDLKGELSLRRKFDITIVIRLKIVFVTHVSCSVAFDEENQIPVFALLVGLNFITRESCAAL